MDLEILCCALNCYKYQQIKCSGKNKPVRIYFQEIESETQLETFTAGLADLTDQRELSSADINRVTDTLVKVIGEKIEEFHPEAVKNITRVSE